jgi:hypothetical protein
MAEIDIRKCIHADMTETVLQSEDKWFIYQWLTDVTKEEFDGNQTKVNAAASYAGIGASGSYEQLQTKLDKFREINQGFAAAGTSSFYFRQGIPDELQTAVARCLNAQAFDQYGLRYLITENSDNHATIVFSWRQLPGLAPQAIQSITSTLDNAKHQNTFDEGSPLAWERGRSDNKVFPSNCLFSGEGQYRMTLKRVDTTRPIRVQVNMNIGESLVFDVPAPPKVRPFKTQFSVKAQDLAPQPYVLRHPQIGFVLACSDMEPGAQLVMDMFGGATPSNGWGMETRLQLVLDAIVNGNDGTFIWKAFRDPNDGNTPYLVDGVLTSGNTAFASGDRFCGVVPDDGCVSVQIVLSYCRFSVGSGPNNVAIAFTPETTLRVKVIPRPLPPR